MLDGLLLTPSEQHTDAVFLLPSSIEPSNSVLDELKTKITIAVEYCTEDLVIFPCSPWDLGMNINMGIVSLTCAYTIIDIPNHHLIVWQLPAKLVESVF
jgi:hypothetical protein